MMEVFEQLPGENAKHYAKRALLYNLVNLEMKPGDKITESDLCELYGISRTPIREAILELHQQNMIDIYPKQGTFVSYIDTAAIDEFLELRNLMEQSVTQLACEKLTPDNIAYLRENIVQWKHHLKNDNLAKTQACDKEFHKYIYCACGKQFWHNIIRENAYQFDRIVILMFSSINTDKLVKDHSDMVDAFEAHDKKKLMKFHFAIPKDTWNIWMNFLSNIQIISKNDKKQNFFQKVLTMFLCSGITLIT